MITSQTLGTTLDARHAGGDQSKIASELVRSAAARSKNGPDRELLRGHVSAAECETLLDFLRE